MMDQDNSRRFGNESAAQRISGSNPDPVHRDTPKFDSDRDDFHRAEDNQDGEMEISNAGFTGSGTSSDLSRDDSGAFTPDTPDGENEQQDASLNDSARKQITNNDASDQNFANL